MKKVHLLSLMLMGASLSFFSCGDDDPVSETQEYTLENLPPDSDVKPTTEQMNATITTYVDAVVLSTYKEMLDKMQLFHDAVDKFIASKAQNDLDDACQAWRNVRIPWEQSEAFLYGVADLGQYDPSLDSWPLDKNGIEEIIATGDFNAVTGAVNEDESADAPQNLRGFHTAEKLLFMDGVSRKADTNPFVKNELTYLQIVADRMLKDTHDLYNGWVSGLGNNPIPTSYAEAMKSHDGSAYADLSSAYQVIEMILNGNTGMAGIANEVGTAKIKDPVDEWNGSNKDADDPNNPGVLAVESWYSWNSLDDYENNIISIKNSYFGGRDLDKATASPNSLHALCKTVNPTLDSLVTVQIDATIEAIQGIPYPFRSNLSAETEINAAMDACANLKKGLDIVRSKLASGE